MTTKVTDQKIGFFKGIEAQMADSFIDEESIEGSEVSLLDRPRVFTPMGKKKALQFGGGHFDFQEDTME